LGVASSAHGEEELFGYIMSVGGSDYFDADQAEPLKFAMLLFTCHRFGDALDYLWRANKTFIAAHLLVALTTLAGVVWTMLDLRALARGEPRARLTGFAALTLGMLLIQLFYGALLAGMRAGTSAGGGVSLNVWPLMQGAFFPAGIDWSAGPAHAFLSDPFLVHFVHRWWAWAVVGVLVAMGRKLRLAGARAASIALHSVFGTQIVLGIATVMSGVAIWIAVLHQLTGALLVVTTAWGAHRLGQRI
jgi:cytochrome c oxidase assembly protein subunit 15